MGVSGRGIFAEDRHITCVKMSHEKADEVGLVKCAEGHSSDI